MLLTYDQEKNLVHGILSASGFSDADAAVIARVIAHSDFTGVYSHGLSRLTRYMRQIKVGALNKDAEFKKVLDDKALLVFDGDNGFGIVSVNKAYDEALVKAREYGISFASGRHNANIGCGSYYGWRAAKDDVICILGCNTYAFSSPFGGADRLIGTNPIIAAVPSSEEFPIVMDISTTNVAMGKIQAAEREGKSVPAGWGKDYDGKMTTDPSKVFSLCPIADYKGYGLAVIVDALSTMVINMPIISEENLRKLLLAQFPTLTDEYAGQFAGLFQELRNKCDSSEISTKALDLRGLLAALSLVRNGLGVYKALELGIINKSFDDFERQLVADLIAARMPRTLSARDIFRD